MAGGKSIKQSPAIIWVDVRNEGNKNGKGNWWRDVERVRTRLGGEKGIFHPYKVPPRGKSKGRQEFASEKQYWKAKTASA